MNARGSFVDEELIRHHTVIASPYLVPEIRLHLITEACPLWTATEEEAAAQGLAEPYWAFAWAGGQALARHLLDHPEVVRARTVLDFGAGGGVQSIAAALAGGKVTANDIDPLAWSALDMNAALNGVQLRCARENLLGRTDLDYQVILAGDLCYESPFSDEILAWLRTVARERNAEVLLADPQRGFLNPQGLEVLAVYRAPTDFDSYGNSLIDTTVYRVR
jgi:predicted nicotinamide N-methyase